MQNSNKVFVENQILKAYLKSLIHFQSFAVIMFMSILNSTQGPMQQMVFWFYTFSLLFDFGKSVKIHISVELLLTFLFLYIYIFVVLESFLFLHRFLHFAIKFSLTYNSKSRFVSCSICWRFGILSCKRCKCVCIVLACLICCFYCTTSFFKNGSVYWNFGITTWLAACHSIDGFLCLLDCTFDFVHVSATRWF